MGWLEELTAQEEALRERLVSVMNYEVRLKLPLFSHLRTLFCLVSAAEAEPAA
jgi:hypothetical protein